MTKSQMLWLNICSLYCRISPVATCLGCTLRFNKRKVRAITCLFPHRRWLQRTLANCGRSIRYSASDSLWSAMSWSQCSNFFRYLSVAHGGADPMRKIPFACVAMYSKTALSQPWMVGSVVLLANCRFTFDESLQGLSRNICICLPRCLACETVRFR